MSAARRAGAARPRTVLLLHSSAGLYGADRQLALIAGGLDPRRYRALVVLAEDGELLRVLRDAGVEVQVRPLAVLRRGLLSARGLAGIARRWAADARFLSRLVRAREVALVHSNTSVTLAGAPAAALARVPHVWHVREIYRGYERAWPAYRRLLMTAAALPCVSQAARAQFGPRAGLVVHDGLTIDVRPAGEEQRSAARRQLGLSDADFACLLLGRLSDWKGQDVLVRALAHPALNGVGAVALMAGDAWGDASGLPDELARLARREGVWERVRLLGFSPDVAPLYAAADLVAVPSIRPDPLPNSALEAAAAGCCLVASDIGGLPEIVSDGRTGVLVAPGDPAALAQALAELARDPLARRRLGLAAAADVRERFAPERLLRRVQDLYDEVLEPVRGRS